MNIHVFYAKKKLKKNNAIFDENNFCRRNKTSSSKLIESPPGITINSKWDKMIGHNNNSNPNKQLDSDSEDERPTHYNHRQNRDTTYDDNRHDSSMMMMVMKRKRWNLQ